MTESEAIKELKEDISLYDNEITRLDASIGTPDRNLIDALEMAINALEKQEKIKEAFEMWKAETGGYYGADDETTRFISTLNQILRSDEE